MTTNIYDSHGVLVERWDNNLRAHFTYAPDGTVTSEVPYTAEENAAADAQIAAAAIEANSVALTSDLRTAVTALKAAIADLNTILAASNTDVNRSPASYVKTLARANKDIARNLIRIAKLTTGDLTDADTGAG